MSEEIWVNLLRSEIGRSGRCLIAVMNCFCHKRNISFVDEQTSILKFFGERSTFDSRSTGLHVEFITF